MNKQLIDTTMKEMRKSADSIGSKLCYIVMILLVL